MRKLFIYLSVSCLAILLTSFAWLPEIHEEVIVDGGQVTTPSIGNGSSYIHVKTPSDLYNLMCLDEKGLSKEAFNYAYRGYQELLNKKLISRPDYLTICDFSQSSKQKRLYLIDLVNNEVVLNTYVAHGRNSGGEYATRFSNKPQSLQSSLGFYVTKDIYSGQHGLSLRVHGLEPGFNDKAYQRAIVVHGANYVEEAWMKQGNCPGRSFGCPALPQKESNTLINTIKNGTCMFIYHPSKKYLQGSKILND